MGNGGRDTAKRQKGNRPPIDFHPDLTRHTHRAHARMTRNDFPVELSPPTSDILAVCVQRIATRNLRVRTAEWWIHHPGQDQTTACGEGLMCLNQKNSHVCLQTLKQCYFVNLIFKHTSGCLLLGREIAVRESTGVRPCSPHISVITI